LDTIIFHCMDKEKKKTHLSKFFYVPKKKVGQTGWEQHKG